MKKASTSPIQASLNITIDLVKEGGIWVSSCDALLLASQGSTQKQALEMFTEALELALDTHKDRGTLSEYLHAAVKRAGKGKRSTGKGISKQISVAIDPMLLAA